MSSVMSIQAAMVKQLVQCTALDGAYHGIRVNGVATGVTNSRSRIKKNFKEQDTINMNLTVAQNAELVRELGRDVPLNGVPNQPEDVAYSMLFVGSEDASMITGEIIKVDGGHSLTNDRFGDYTTSLRSNKTAIYD